MTAHRVRTTTTATTWPAKAATLAQEAHLAPGGATIPPADNRRPAGTGPPPDRVLVPPEAVALLAALLDEVRGLRADLARPHTASTLTRRDHARLARILPPLGAVFGSEPFTAAECVDDDAPAAVRLVTRGLNARQLGRLFRRAAGQPVEGYVIERCGLERNAALWRVLRVVEFPGEENSGVPPRVITTAV